MAVLVCTRIGRFGGQIELPDASLAVFFLLGLWELRVAWFCGAVAIALLVDLAVTGGGSCAHCFTPAYAGLVITYAAPWYAGRWLARAAPPQLGVHSWPRAVAILGASVVAAFVISNLTFFLGSGQLTGMAAGTYVAAVIHYLPPYLGWALAYGLAGIISASLNRTHAPMVATQARG